MYLKQIFIFLLIFMTMGCLNSSNDDIISNDLAGLSEDEIESIEPIGFHEGNVVITDSNKDGVDDTVSYTFEMQEVAPDIYMEKNLEYKTTLEGTEGTITIEFSGTGTDEYEHIEYIPKSFATNIDDLEFSVEPDEIVNPDPAAKWILNTINTTLRKIIIKTKKSGEEQGTGAALGTMLTSSVEQLGNLVNGEKTDFSKIGRETVAAGTEKGKEAAIDTLLDNLEDFIFISDLSVCANKKNPTEVDLCVLALVDKHPEWFTEADCIKIFPDSGFNYNYENYRAGSCEALIKNDVNVCDKFKKGNDFAACRSYFSTIKIISCMRETPGPDSVTRPICSTDYHQKDMCGSFYLEEDTIDCCNRLKDSSARDNCYKNHKIGKYKDENTPVSTSTASSTPSATTITEDYQLSADLERLTLTNAFFVSFCAYGTHFEDKDGAQRTYDDTKCIHLQNDGNLSWNGRVFDGSATKQWTDSFGQLQKQTQELGGTVSEEGDKVVLFSGSWRADDEANGDVRTSSISISDVPIERGGGFENENPYQAIISGTDVRFYVSDPKWVQETIQPSTGKRFYYEWFKTVDWQNTDYPPKLTIKFITRDYY